ncbi:MAG TPA: hypothetical protein VG033_08630 [Candidatus Acidoferrales bacterium]|jgi:hypothetical protein|nr:hypothetical protein [Candidatus Acidoferrales bacterium]
MHRKPLFTILAVLMIPVLPALCRAQSGGQTNLAMIGITNVQVLQINLTADSTGTCAAKLGFQNSEGVAVGPTSSVTLAAGQSTSLELKGSVLTKVPKQRVEVLPVVTPSTNFPPTPCHASAEIIEGTPAATIAGGVVSFPPVPIFAAVGITESINLRLNVVAYPPNPCIGELSFADENGKPVGGTLNVNLSAGQAAFLDLPGTTVANKSGEIVLVQPIFMITTTMKTACVVSVELYSAANAATIAYWPPNPV